MSFRVQEIILNFTKSNYDQNKPLIEAIKQDNQNAFLDCTEAISTVLKNKSIHPEKYLYALKFAKDTIQTFNMDYIQLAENTFLESIYQICTYKSDSTDPNRGSTFFGEKSTDQEKIFANSLFRLALECIKVWAQWFPSFNNQKSVFLTYYQNLVYINVSFPPYKYFSEDLINQHIPKQDYQIFLEKNQTLFEQLTQSFENKDKLLQINNQLEDQFLEVSNLLEKYLESKPEIINQLSEEQDKIQIFLQNYESYSKGDTTLEQFKSLQLGQVDGITPGGPLINNPMEPSSIDNQLDPSNEQQFKNIDSQSYQKSEQIQYKSQEQDLQVIQEQKQDQEQKQKQNIDIQVNLIEDNNQVFMKQINDLQQQLESEKQQRNELESEINTLKNLISNGNNKDNSINELLQENEQLKQQNQQLVMKNEQLITQQQDIIKNNMNKDQEQDSNKQLNQIQYEISVYKQELKDKKMTIKQLQEELDNIHVEKNILKEQFNQSNNQIDYSKKYQELKIKYDKLDSQYTNLHLKNERNSKSIDELMEINNQLKMDIKKYKYPSSLIQSQIQDQQSRKTEKNQKLNSNFQSIIFPGEDDEIENQIESQLINLNNDVTELIFPYNNIYDYYYYAKLNNYSGQFVTQVQTFKGIEKLSKQNQQLFYDANVLSCCKLYQSDSLVIRQKTVELEQNNNKMLSITLQFKNEGLKNIHLHLHLMSHQNNCNLIMKQEEQKWNIQNHSSVKQEYLIEYNQPKIPQFAFEMKINMEPELLLLPCSLIRFVQWIQISDEEFRQFWKQQKVRQEQLIFKSTIIMIKRKELLNQMLQYGAILNNSENKILKETKFGFLALFQNTIKIYLKLILITGGYLIIQGSSQTIDGKQLVQHFTKQLMEILNQ